LSFSLVVVLGTRFLPEACLLPLALGELWMPTFGGKRKAEPPPVRRRLRQKQAAPEAYATPEAAPTGPLAPYDPYLRRQMREDPTTTKSQLRKQLYADRQFQCRDQDMQLWLQLWRQSAVSTTAAAPSTGVTITKLAELSSYDAFLRAQLTEQPTLGRTRLCELLKIHHAVTCNHWWMKLWLQHYKATNEAPDSNEAATDVATDGTAEAYLEALLQLHPDWGRGSLQDSLSKEKGIRWSDHAMKQWMARYRANQSASPAVFILFLDCF